MTEKSRRRWKYLEAAATSFFSTVTFHEPETAAVILVLCFAPLLLHFDRETEYSEHYFKKKKKILLE